MRLLVGIDDTDSIDSDHGTGRVSRDLGAALAADHDLDWIGSVRQQFLVDPRVPYTTHNSGACLVFEAEDPPFDAVVDETVRRARRLDLAFDEITEANLESLGCPGIVPAASEAAE